jgi:hypothetical protein
LAADWSSIGCRWPVRAVVSSAPCLGDDRKIGEVRANGIEQAHPSPYEFLQLLPGFVVVLF